jgi:GNAT superfamily N-acetyltransferase
MQTGLLAVDERAFAAERGFDLVLMSAFLPYSAPRSRAFWARLTGEVRDRLRPPCAVAAIEPQAKTGILNHLTDGFRATRRFRVVEHYALGSEPPFQSHGLGTLVVPRQMERLNGLLRDHAERLARTGALREGAPMRRHLLRSGVVSWNETRSESVALCLDERRPGPLWWVVSRMRRRRQACQRPVGVHDPREDRERRRFR